MPKQLGKETFARDIQRIRTALGSIPAVSAPADHGSLLGLGDDDHPQYASLAQNETVTGLWTFQSTATPQVKIGYDANNRLEITAQNDGDVVLETFGTVGDIYLYPKNDLYLYPQSGQMTAAGEVMVNDVGILPTAGVQLESRTSTKTHLRLAYDGSNYVDFTATSGGGLTVETSTAAGVFIDADLVIANAKRIMWQDSLGSPAQIFQFDSADVLHIGSPSGDHAATSFWRPGISLSISMQILNDRIQLNFPERITTTTQPQLRLEYNASNYANFSVTSGGNLIVAPSGDFLFNPTGNDVYPVTGYDLNLGLINKKWLTLHAAELWVETLVAHDTMATIGGRILVAPTTTLEADLAPAGTTITVKHNQMASGDRVRMEADGKLEWMAITSAPSGTGPYTYTVTRNLDGTGANQWYAGDAIVNTGVAGEGFIDLYSLSGVISGTVGPTIVGYVRESATYNDVTEAWAIGNLNGVYGQGSIMGVGLGHYNVGDYALFTESGIEIFSGASRIASWLGTTITLGVVTEAYMTITPTALNLYDSAGTSRVELTGTTVRVGRDNDARVSISDAGIAFINASNAQVGNISTSATGLWFGASSSTERIQWDSTNGLRLFNHSNVNVLHFDTTGNAYLKGALEIASGGSIKVGTDVTINEASGITLGTGGLDINYVKWGSLTSGPYLYIFGSALAGITGMTIAARHSSFNSGAVIQAIINTTSDYSYNVIRGYGGAGEDWRGLQIGASAVPVEAVDINGRIHLDELADPTTPATGVTLWNADTGSRVKARFDNGAEVTLADNAGSAVYVPLDPSSTNASYSGGSVNTSGTAVSISNWSGNIPTSAKAVAVKVSVRSATTGTWASVGTDSGNQYVVIAKVWGANLFNDNNGIVPVDSLGRIYITTSAAVDLDIKITGYFI